MAVAGTGVAVGGTGVAVGGATAVAGWVLDAAGVAGSSSDPLHATRVARRKTDANNNTSHLELGKRMGCSSKQVSLASHGFAQSNTRLNAMSGVFVTYGVRMTAR
jgi:hypothetical protein